MKNLFVIIFATLLIGNAAQAQYCSITITPMNATVCIGDSVLITSISNLVNAGQAFDFNNSSMPTGWSSGGGTTFGTPCGQNPTATPYYWAGSAGNGTPQITTSSFDISCGGFINFDMVYAVQSGAAPCEGPDLANEGVSLQYSTDGGLTWITINYYSPGGYVLPTNPGTSAGVVGTGQTAYTTWNSFVIPIPIGAATTSTAFRWIQTNSSGACCDNWGLDNIIINSSGAPCGATTVVNWDNGLTDTDSFWAVPTGDTTFQAQVFDTLGNFQCLSSIVQISVHPDILTYSLVDTVYSFCPTTAPTVEVTNISSSTSPYSVSWSIPSTNNPVVLPLSGLDHDTTTYYVTIYDGCNYQRQDSVVFIMNKKLDIDTMLSFPATCDPTGAVSGVIVGATGIPFYTWNGPGANNPSFINASVWENLASGWYYFNVVDDVCSDYDSVFVDILNGPEAIFSADPITGCDPLEVTFTNTSENTFDYKWDFGNGNTANVSDLSSQTQTYTQSTTVQLIAFASPFCSDTAYISIVVSICGCTDPTAVNYNASATLDDGSCYYPTSTASAPNVFTPNGDTNNDVFYINAKNYTNIDLTITNRWGNLMYFGSGINPAWDGKTKNGALAEEGTYFYKYTVTPISGAPLEGSGFLQLKRD